MEYLEIDIVATPTGWSPSASGDATEELAPVDGVTGRVESGADRRADRPRRAVDEPSTPSSSSWTGSTRRSTSSRDDRRAPLRAGDTPAAGDAATTSCSTRGGRRAATRGHRRRVVDGLAEIGRAELFPHSVEVMFVDTYETLVRVTEEFDVARDLLGGVRDYYQAKITERQNEVGKKLTVIASLVLVPSLIVGFYGQNFAG